MEELMKALRELSFAGQNMEELTLSLKHPDWVERNYPTQEELAELLERVSGLVNEAAEAIATSKAHLSSYSPTSSIQ